MEIHKLELLIFDDEEDLDCEVFLARMVEYGLIDPVKCKTIKQVKKHVSDARCDPKLGALAGCCLLRCQRASSRLFSNVHLQKLVSKMHLQENASI